MVCLTFSRQRRSVFMENSRNIRTGKGPDAAQETPLIRVRDKIVINKNTVTASAGDSLQGKGNEIAEASARHGVLARGKPVVTVKFDMMTLHHREPHRFRL